MLKKNLLMIVIIVAAITLLFEFSFGAEDDVVLLLSHTSQPVTPIDLPNANEGFFIRFNPGTPDEFTLIEASVWICGVGDNGWPYPDRTHQSFIMTVYEADDNSLGREYYTENVLADDRNFPHLVTIEPDLEITGPFFLAAIQRGAHPNVEALMMDSEVNNPDMQWTNTGGRWGLCVDRIPTFSGDLFSMCRIDRSTSVPGTSNENILRSFTLGQPAPNPFNNMTVLQISLPHSQTVKTLIYSLDGSEVMNRIFPDLQAGVHHITLDLKGHPSGLYIARFQSGNSLLTRRLVFMK